MYKTIADRRDEDRRAALLWLYITSKGLLPDFTEFCRERKDMSLAEVEAELRAETQKQ